MHQIQAFITTFKILIADSNQSTFIWERFVNRIEESRNELNGLKTDFYGSVSEILDFDNRFHFNSNILEKFIILMFDCFNQFFINSFHKLKKTGQKIIYGSF